MENIAELKGARIVKTGFNVYEVRSKNGITIYEAPSRAECEKFLRGDLL